MDSRSPHFVLVVFLDRVRHQAAIARNCGLEFRLVRMHDGRSIRERDVRIHAYPGQEDSILRNSQTDTAGQDSIERASQRTQRVGIEVDNPQTIRSRPICQVNEFPAVRKPSCIEGVFRRTIRNQDSCRARRGICYPDLSTQPHRRLEIGQL